MRVVSILGRFLEHHRIFRFENGGKPQFFIGSADWMARNLTRRVEVVTPVEDKGITAELQTILEACLADQRQGWELLPDGRYQLHKVGLEAEEAHFDDDNSSVSSDSSHLRDFSLSASQAAVDGFVAETQRLGLHQALMNQTTRRVRGKEEHRSQDMEEHLLYMGVPNDCLSLFR